MVSKSIYGYFSRPDTDIPEYDPGLAVDCPVCHRKLEPPWQAVCLMVPNDSRSYFYRMHKECSDRITPEVETAIDSILIDAIYRLRELS